MGLAFVREAIRMQRVHAAKVGVGSWRRDQKVVYYSLRVQKVVYFIGSSVLCTESSVLCVRCTLPVELRDGRLQCVRDCTLEMELRESHFCHSLSSILCVQFISVLPYSW